MVVNASSPPFATVDDAKIFRCIQIAFARHRHLPVQDLSITVRQGIVTLQGTVDSYKRKSFASDVVLRIDGVQGVINQLKVSGEQQLVDAEIARRLRQRLHTIPFFPAGQITVAVSEGVVTLSGIVDQLQRVYQVEDEAFWTEGVRDIINHLTFRTVEPDPWNQGIADQ
jgi:osmotically-inducible protein OsmY